jgi:hypothetical protein
MYSPCRLGEVRRGEADVSALPLQDSPQIARLDLRDLAYHEPGRHVLLAGLLLEWEWR